MARFTAPKAGELRLRHDYLQSIIEADLSAREMRLLLAILDETTGWSRRSVSKPLGYWSLRTGIGQDNIARVLKRLADLGWISWTRGTKAGKGTRGSAGAITLLRQQKAELRVAESTVMGDGASTAVGDGASTVMGDGTSQAVTNNIKTTERDAGASLRVIEGKGTSTTAPSEAFAIWSDEWARSCGGVTQHPTDTPPAHIERLDAALHQHGAVILRQACRSFFRSDRVKYHNLKVFTRPAMLSYFLRLAAKDRAADAEYNRRWRETQEREQQARLAAEAKRRVVAADGTARISEPKHLGGLLREVLTVSKGSVANTGAGV